MTDASIVAEPARAVAGDVQEVRWRGAAWRAGRGRLGGPLAGGLLVGGLISTAVANPCCYDYACYSNPYAPEYVYAYRAYGYGESWWGAWRSGWGGWWRWTPRLRLLNPPHQTSARESTPAATAQAEASAVSPPMWSGAVRRQGNRVLCAGHAERAGRRLAVRARTARTGGFRVWQRLRQRVRGQQCGDNSDKRFHAYDVALHRAGAAADDEAVGGSRNGAGYRHVVAIMRPLGRRHFVMRLLEQRNEG